MQRQITAITPTPYFDLDRSQWAILDKWTPSPVTVVDPLPAQHWTEALSARQVKSARRALGVEMRIADHVQSRRSEIDGWAMVEVFIGRRCYTVTLGPKGGVKAQEQNLVV